MNSLAHQLYIFYFDITKIQLLIDSEKFIELKSVKIKVKKRYANKI